MLLIIGDKKKHKSIESSPIIRTFSYLCQVRLLNKKLLKKLLDKKKGDKALRKAIFKLVNDFEGNKIERVEDLLSIRSDADKVHSDGFYFFNLRDYRTMIMIVFEDDQAAVLWCGNHDKYELIFKNNKNTIEKWLKNKKYI